LGNPDVEEEIGAELACPLRTAEILHAGRGAAFGLGRIEVR